HHHRKRQPRRAEQVSRRMAKISHHRIEHRKTAHATNLLFDLFHSAEFDPSQPHGVLRRSAIPDVLLRERVQACSQLVVEFLLHLALPQESSYAPEHQPSPVVICGYWRAAAITSATRFQSRSSMAARLRPAAVSL